MWVILRAYAVRPITGQRSYHCGGEDDHSLLVWLLLLLLGVPLLARPALLLVFILGVLGRVHRDDPRGVDLWVFTWILGKEPNLTWRIG